MQPETEKTLIGLPPRNNSWVELVRFVVIALIIVIPFRVFISQPFIVSGSSMFPTFQNGNYLIVDELTYKLRAPQRGDVIVFKYPGDTSKYFIKRIVGLPSETVDIRGSQVVITNKEHPGGLLLTEPFVQNQSQSLTHFQLKADEYFVLGDNRSGSSDSRYWGAVPKKLLIGRAFIRLWPLNEISILPGDYKQK